ncbi:MAG TPA: AraC family transcriptional regulator [Steroidobacteraceae bacterium]|jgi:AraC-like DNA-binding protein
MRYKSERMVIADALSPTDDEGSSAATPQAVMQATAIGRILIWRGGSLWIGLAGEPAGLHAHHAVQISLPFARGRVRFQRDCGAWKSYSAALVAADQPHAFEARGQLLVQIFVEPESPDGRQLQRRYGSEGIAALPPGTLKQEIAALASGYQRRADDAALVALARAAIQTLAGDTGTAKGQFDARIARAVELIRRRLGGPIPLKQMAAAVHLSPDRFRHLFMQETRVSFRAYLLWLRLEVALEAYVAGSTLTDAAHLAGFADSAHFSRNFKRMFGIAAASIRTE